MTRAFIIANLCGTLLAGAVMALIANYGDAISTEIGEWSLTGRIELGCVITAIPLLLIWFPALLGERPPTWVSPKTNWEFVYGLGWFLLIGIVCATVFALLLDEDGIRPFW